MQPDEEQDIEMTMIKERVKPQELKLPGPIRAMEGQERFSVVRVLDDTNITLPLGQLLDKSDAVWKELAWYLQSSTPHYQTCQVTN